jgi:hypothetical protein
MATQLESLVQERDHERVRADTAVAEKFEQQLISDNLQLEVQRLKKALEDSQNEAEAGRRQRNRQTVVIFAPPGVELSLRQVREQVHKALPALYDEAVEHVMKSGPAHVVFMCSRRAAEMVLSKGGLINFNTRTTSGTGRGWGVAENLTKQQRQQLNQAKEQLKGRVLLLQQEGARPRWRGTQLVVLMTRPGGGVMFAPHTAWDLARKVPPRTTAGIHRAAAAAGGAPAAAGAGSSTGAAAAAEGGNAGGGGGSGADAGGGAGDAAT